MTDSNDQCVLEVGAVETKFFQFLLTEEERKDDSKKESKWNLNYLEKKRSFGNAVFGIRYVSPLTEEL